MHAQTTVSLEQLRDLLLVDFAKPRDDEGSAIYPHLSGTLGAKQLVVVKMHTMFSLPNSLTFFSISETSVLNSSPSKTFSMITGIKPENKGSKTIVCIQNFSTEGKPANKQVIASEKKEPTQTFPSLPVHSSLISEMSTTHQNIFLTDCSVQIISFHCIACR